VSSIREPDVLRELFDQQLSHIDAHLHGMIHVTDFVFPRTEASSRIDPRFINQAGSL
jgi:hypothetical protein